MMPDINLERVMYLSKSMHLVFNVVINFLKLK